MHVITKGRRYLGFDGDGHHEWKDDPLDAIRFGSEEEALQSGREHLKTGAFIREADPWDGHYESYMGHEIQVFHDAIRDIPGGKRWKVRYGTTDLGLRAENYVSLASGYTRPEAALQAAKRAVASRVHP